MVVTTPERSAPRPVIGATEGRPPALLRRIARALLSLCGWRVRGEPPPLKKYVLIGAPHTSNWDFPVGILALWALRIPGRWVGKHTLFRPPFGWIMRRLGGIPLNRARTRDFVPHMVEEFRRREELVLLIAPEGTRSLTPRWRSGFYHIAHGAGVPIVLGFADFGRKETGIGPVLTPTGDPEADMAKIRAFYEEKTGKRPEKTSPIRLEAPGEGSG